MLHWTGLCSTTSASPPFTRLGGGGSLCALVLTGLVAAVPQTMRALFFGSCVRVCSGYSDYDSILLGLARTGGIITAAGACACARVFFAPLLCIPSFLNMVFNRWFLVVGCRHYHGDCIRGASFHCRACAQRAELLSRVCSSHRHLHHQKVCV